MGAITRLSQLGAGAAAYGTFAPKPIAAAAAAFILVEEFDTWRDSYAGAVVSVYAAGTTTLLPLWSDPSLTIPITNPQTLLSKTDAAANSYGKFAQTVYTNQAYSLNINGSEYTGIQRPGIASLNGQDASAAAVAVAGGVPRTLADKAGRVVYAEDYGTFGSSASANANIITSAIGICASLGGGYVMLPAKTISFTTLQVPANVILKGAGRDVTVLQSQVADKAIKITGDGGGLEDITIDGVQLVPASWGLWHEGLNRQYLRRVTIKRFNTGIQVNGAFDADWRDVIVTNCGDGVHLYGDVDASNGSLGSVLTRLNWDGGEVSLCTGYGIALQYNNLAVYENRIAGLRIHDNVGTAAVYILGAVHTLFERCAFYANSVNIWTADTSAIVTTNLTVRDGSINAGVTRFAGASPDFLLDRVTITWTAPATPIGAPPGSFDLSTPTYVVVLKDAIENGSPTYTGDAQKISRWRTLDNDVLQGQTTNNTATTIWKRTLAPGEVVLLEMAAAAVLENSADYAQFLTVHAASCPGATLTIKNQTVAFTVGKTITGATSGATAIVQATSGSTATLIRISGTFVDSEALSDGAGGNGQVNGALTFNAAVVASTAAAATYANKTTGAVNFVGPTLAVAGRELHVNVTGDTAKTADWSVQVRVTDRI